MATTPLAHTGKAILGKSVAYLCITRSSCEQVHYGLRAPQPTSDSQVQLRRNLTANYGTLAYLLNMLVLLAILGKFGRKSIYGPVTLKIFRFCILVHMDKA